MDEIDFLAVRERNLHYGPPRHGSDDIVSMPATTSIATAHSGSAIQLAVFDDPYISVVQALAVAELGVPLLVASDLCVPHRERLELVTADEVRRWEKPPTKLLTNSEAPLELILDLAANSSLHDAVTIFKRKDRFREVLAPLAPSLRFETYTVDELATAPYHRFRYPLILKPARGFLSKFIYSVPTADDWPAVMARLAEELERACNNGSDGSGAGDEGARCDGAYGFPASVLSTELFLVEDKLEGEELAVDAYFDERGAPVLLDLYHHPFASEDDTPDRLYYTQLGLVRAHRGAVLDILRQIGELVEMRNFPLHLELIRRGDGSLVPLEVNPLRFAGLGTSDLGLYAYDIDVTRAFFSGTRPDWDRILDCGDGDAGEAYCCFVIGELPERARRAHQEGHAVRIDRDGIRALLGRSIHELRWFDELELELELELPFVFIAFVRVDRWARVEEILHADMERYVHPV